MTYPRTSSEHLTEAMKDEVVQTIDKLMKMPEYASFTVSSECRQEFTSRHFNDKKVGSHPAIIPTMNVPENLEKLSEDEKMLYDLLAKSLIRTVYPKAEIDDTTVILDVNGNPFKATGSVTVSNGWYDVDALPEKKKSLPNINEGMTFPGTYSLKKGEKEPPKCYLCSVKSRKTLLGEMVKVRQSVIAEKCGIRTTGTVSRTIRNLQEKGLVQMVIPTEKANRMRGTNSYIIAKPSIQGGFFYVDRNIFSGRLNSRQIRVYLFIARSYSHKIGYCWNSYNDIANQLGIKRTDVIDTIKELAALKFIRKIRVRSHQNYRVFVDNHYLLIFRAKHSGIKRKNYTSQQGAVDKRTNFCKKIKKSTR